MEFHLKIHCIGLWVNEHISKVKFDIVTAHKNIYTASAKQARRIQNNATISSYFLFNFRVNK